MSYNATDWAFKQPIEDAGAKLVLLAICHHADAKGEAFPSYSRISELTGLAKRTVSRKVAILIEMGLLRAEERTRPNGSRTSSLYFVDIKASKAPVSECPPPVSERLPPVVTQTRPPSHSVTPIINQYNKPYKSSSSIKDTPKKKKEETKEGEVDFSGFLR